MSLIITGKLNDHQIPRERYRYLKASDLQIYLQMIDGDISYESFNCDNYSNDIKNIQFRFSDGYLRNILQNRSEYDCCCCNISFLKVTIKLANGYTQILQYEGSHINKQIQMIQDKINESKQKRIKKNIKAEINDMRIEQERQKIIRNSKSYHYGSSNKNKLTFWSLDHA